MLYILKVQKENGQSTYKQDGGQSILRFGKSVFVDGVAPASLEVTGPFVVKAPKAPKVKLTKEERAALPKPTTAEKLAAAQARVAKLQAALEL